MPYVSDKEKYTAVTDKLVRDSQVLDNKFVVISINVDAIKVQEIGVKCTIKVSS